MLEEVSEIHMSQALSDTSNSEGQRPWHPMEGPGSVLRTEPFCKARRKRQRRVNPSIGVVEYVSGDGEGYGHLGESLEDGPDTGAYDAICDDHIAWAGECERLADDDKDAAAHAVTEGDELSEG